MEEYIFDIIENIIRSGMKIELSLSNNNLSIDPPIMLITVRGPKDVIMKEISLDQSKFVVGTDFIFHRALSIAAYEVEKAMKKRQEREAEPVGVI